MSFFNDNKVAGMAVLILGVLYILGAIVALYYGATAEGGADAGAILAAVGSLISGFIVLKFGMDMRNGAFSDKTVLLGKFVYMVGITTIIGGIFTVLLSVGSAVFGIILGIIILLCGMKIQNASGGTIEKILWIILMIISILMLIGGIMTLAASVAAIITGVCGIILGIFLILLLLDDSVKKQMGM